MKTPLYTALLEHAKRNPISLHVPGHKNGQVMLEQAVQVYKDIMAIDLTEVSGLDDLHDPKGVIAEAQQLTAELYGAQRSYFLVNGSTVGNLAMIMACCSEGDEVLVQRNSHKSIIHGIQLAGATPIFLSPKIDEEYQVPSYVKFETVKEAITLYPNVKALILTNPNYYGLTSCLRDIVKFAHNHHIPVLVDEAHGAHFIAGRSFPVSALEVGADIVIHSAHKTLPAMTMGSFLHINSERIDREKLEFYLSMLQSSSPSYPIMASLDLARAYLSRIIQENKHESILDTVRKVKHQINSMEQLQVVETQDKLVRTDPLKVTIKSTNGLSGFVLQEHLERYDLYAELSNPSHVLFILPLNDEDIVGEKLSKINFELSLGSKNKSFKKKLDGLEMKGIHRLEKPYSYFKHCKKQLVRIEESVGHYSAESIVPYPPGIPFIMNGETITEELVETLKWLLESGVNIQGDHHIRQGKISIYKEGV